MRINYNVAANLANNKLQFNNKKLGESIEKLSSGLQINSAADDAAAMCIAKKMHAQIRGLQQANNNAEDGVSIINTIDGSMSEIHDILQRMNELCIQSANGTNATADRDYIQTEIDQMLQEIDRIADTTQFNAQNLLDGSYALKGYTSSENINVFAYSDYVNTGDYSIDSISYTYCKNTIIDKEGNETVKDTYEINDLEAVKNGLGNDFPEGCKVTSDEEIITISGDNNFEIQLAVNNRVALTDADTATGAVMTTSTTGVSYYTTKAYANVAVIDETNNIRYNLSELVTKLKTDEDGNALAGETPVISDSNYRDLTDELVADGAIDASRTITNIEYQYDESAAYDAATNNPRVLVTLDDGTTINFALDYSIEEKLGDFANYDEEEVTNYEYDAVNSQYNVYINGSTTVSYSVPESEISNPIDSYLNKTTKTEEYQFTVGVPGTLAQDELDEAAGIGTTANHDNITVNITNMGGMRLQVGANQGQVIEMTIPSMGTKYMGIDDLDVTTEEDATKGIDKISAAINYVSQNRAKMGAYENRLEHTITNLDTSEENITSAYSRIMDVDMSEEMVRYSTYNILVQSSTSMLSHANEAPQSALQLLQ